MLCGAGQLERVNAWIGTAGTVTPCHFDSYDNLLGQVAGFKSCSCIMVREMRISEQTRMYLHSLLHMYTYTYIYVLIYVLVSNNIFHITYS